MRRFVVLGKEPVFLRHNVSRRSASRKQRSRLASLTLAQEDDLGINDRQFEERSHVGYLMKAGDVCVGFDLTETQFVEEEAENMRSSGKLPDVVVIRKLYGGVANGDADAAKKRKWKLKRLDAKVAESMKSARAAKKDTEAEDIDEEDFMREVEADREMRDQMYLYKSEVLKKEEEKGKVDDATMDGDVKKTVSGEEEEDDYDDDQEIKLDELLDGLVIDDGPDPEDAPPEEFAEFLEEGGQAAKDGIKYVGRDESRQIKDKEVAIPQSTFGKEYGA